MLTFITDNFLLQNETAVRLYHEYARDMPILDYHCHLPPHRSPRIAASITSPKSGSTAITTSGGRCGPRAWPSGTAPATPPTGRSSRNGPRRSPRRSATRSTTGRTWN